MNETKRGAELVTPYSDRRDKTDQVEEMFDSIAPAYDFMNTAMTFGLHRWWRSRALDAASKELSSSPRAILDIATGTGDVAFDLHRRFPEAEITGIDLSDGMLEVAREKLAKCDASARNRISFIQGDSLDLFLPDNSQDMITVAYGVRNFEHLKQGYREMLRVLRPGGTLCVIELSRPASKIPFALYNIYSHHIIPFAGRIVSGDTRAYSYLPESIAAAPQRNDMTSVMESCGFTGCRWKSLTFGAVTYYIAHK
ncbi:bifunctional demethylmenaquinone methyltransferase/2-methoxy-6-polyprenyl-1,4-benzoquinol methylase UbiE [Muribaculaceae bacterium Isolate-113 (HZI)]|nr:bifunctional demethylmenaquinone methyltransferase/2-methoxy-6-polyprenyl-1,4-benzoquinol methylase UbiE [Muribaculaceae bacterium Isolate-113 (HZI)]ROT23090.1 bifunctional demethylmenaquinone methyltransferase/2-methoxy-6-polyprenyl-1,4-benzoquinol methylase UbiE [Muribaculaceae bacterium Isolate-114 (HZI)]